MDTEPTHESAASSIATSISLGKGPQAVPISLSDTPALINTQSDPQSFGSQQLNPGSPESLHKTLSDLSPPSSPPKSPVSSADIETDSDYSDDEEDEKIAAMDETVFMSKESIDKAGIDRIKTVSIFMSADQVRRERKATEDFTTNIDDNWKAKRQYLEQQLIETEERYCDSLNVLCNEILADIFKSKMLDATKYRKQLSSTLPQIFEFHTDHFLPELKEGHPVEIFVKYSDFFKMYSQFANDYDSILDILARKGNKSKNKKLYKYLKQKRKEKKAITSLLISPIQRVPRYMLLLEDIKKATPTHYDDYDLIVEALQKIKDIAHEINQRQRDIDNMSQCFQIQAKLRNFKDNVVEARRKFLNQWTFLKQEGKKRKMVQFCVFNDIIIVTDGKWKFLYKLENRSIVSFHKTHCGKGIELKYAKDVQTYWATKNDGSDELSNVDEICEIMENNRKELEDKRLQKKEAVENALAMEMERIQQELDEDRRRILKKIRLKRSSLTPKSPMQKRNSLPTYVLPDKKDLWLRTDNQFGNTRVVTWQFVDGNHIERTVILNHDQDLKNGLNAKTKRSLEVDTQMVVPSQVSNQNIFEHDLVIDAERGDESIKIEVEIRFEKKGFSDPKFGYRLTINGIAYSVLQYQSAHQLKE